MRKEFLLYYLSRAILSIVFALLVFGFNWKAALLAAVFFGFFLLYLHSGWFIVDPAHRLTPLRRDDRAMGIQRVALIAAITVGLLTYISQSYLVLPLNLPPPAINLALPLAIFTYFITQFVLLAKA